MMDSAMRIETVREDRGKQDRVTLALELEFSRRAARTASRDADAR